MPILHPQSFWLHTMTALLQRRCDFLFSLLFLTAFNFDVLQALSRGANANAGGVAAVLELMRTLRQMYTTSNSRPQYNIVALLSAGGRVGYLGTRHWVETYHQAASCTFIGLLYYTNVKCFLCLSPSLTTRFIGLLFYICTNA
jgi:hypothetical protein